MTEARLKDWTALCEAGRRDAWQRCRSIAQCLQGRLSAFLEIVEDIDKPAEGPLKGLPYAAKDMFQVPGHRPTWGLAEPVPNLPDWPKADVLDHLDLAGARRVGFTRMTALAYEPSGINPLQQSPLNPWDSEIVPGASSSGSSLVSPANWA